MTTTHTTSYHIHHSYLFIGPKGTTPRLSVPTVNVVFPSFTNPWQRLWLSVLGFIVGIIVFQFLSCQIVLTVAQCATRVLHGCFVVVVVTQNDERSDLTEMRWSFLLDYIWLTRGKELFSWAAQQAVRCRCVVVVVVGGGIQRHDDLYNNKSNARDKSAVPWSRNRHHKHGLFARFKGTAQSVSIGFQLIPILCH